MYHEWITWPLSHGSHDQKQMYQLWMVYSEDLQEWITWPLSHGSHDQKQMCQLCLALDEVLRRRARGRGAKQAFRDFIQISRGPHTPHSLHNLWPRQTTCDLSYCYAWSYHLQALPHVFLTVCPHEFVLTSDWRCGLFLADLELATNGTLTYA